MDNSTREPSKPASVYSDEIDLRLVLRKLNQLYHRLLSGLKRTAIINFNYFFLLVLTLLLGIGAGQLVFQVKRKYFISTMTLAPAEIRNDYFKGEVERMNKLVMDGNLDEISANLNMSKDKASFIKSLKFSNLDQFSEEVDTVIYGGPFSIEAEVYDQTIFVPLQKGLVHYFNKNDFFTKSTGAKREYMERVLAKLEYDIASLDSAKQSSISLKRLKQPVNELVKGDLVDQAGLYETGLNLVEKQEYLRSRLKTLEIVQVVVGFAPIQKPTKPVLKEHLIIGGIIGYLIGLLLAFWYDNHKRSKASLI